jgi:hypothetical protein
MRRPTSTPLIVAAAISCLTLLLSPDPGPAAEDFRIDAKSFRCITTMTPVRHFYVDNLQGQLEATVAAARSPTGAVYPPGSVVQLVPGEAMVKRDKGFNAATRDWEFFELEVSKEGTQIRKRGSNRHRQSIRRELLWMPHRRPSSSGIWCAKATTVAPPSRSPAR